MAITIRKTLPTSARYTGSGDTTIDLVGAEEIIVNTKKSLIKIPFSQDLDDQKKFFTDLGINLVVDLKRIEDTIKIRAWLEDDDTETAWNKAWKLRAMCSSGGPITALVIENITFDGGVGTQPVFLEEVTFIVKPNLGKTIDTDSQDNQAARLIVDLTFYLGDDRFL